MLSWDHGYRGAFFHKILQWSISFEMLIGLVALLLEYLQLAIVNHLYSFVNERDPCNFSSRSKRTVLDLSAVSLSFSMTLDCTYQNHLYSFVTTCLHFVWPSIRCLMLEWNISRLIITVIEKVAVGSLVTQFVASHSQVAYIFMSISHMTSFEALWTKLGPWSFPHPNLRVGRDGYHQTTSGNSSNWHVSHANKQGKVPHVLCKQARKGSNVIMERFMQDLNESKERCHKSHENKAGWPNVQCNHGWTHAIPLWIMHASKENQINIVII